MSRFARLDRKEWYELLADQARRSAEESPDPLRKAMWLEMAESWMFLAVLETEACFCGLPAIGLLFQEDGTRCPYCADHMAQNLWKARPADKPH
jgi:hypothetical protein